MLGAVIESVWRELAITWPQAAAVAVSTTVLFWVFAGLLAWLGQALNLRVSVMALAVAAVIGAVTARSMLGDAPKLAGGLVALVVLFGWAWAVETATGGRWGRRLPKLARAVVVDGQVDDAMLKLSRLRPSDLWVRLRRAGVTRLADVRYAIVENDGSFTVVRAGQDIDRELLAGVAGLPAGSAAEPPGEAPTR
jgi:uncharacterized membrane protein YcaP (DUF421 family)